VDESLVVDSIESMTPDACCLFAFSLLARYAPQLEESLERAMLASLKAQEKLSGRTVLLVDVSGSMMASLSRRSEILRTDAAYGLAILLREICEKQSRLRFGQLG